MKKNEILNELGKANQQTLFYIYSLYRERFVDFGIRRYPVNRSEVIFIYKDTVIGLYENVINGKFFKLKISPRRFIFERGNRKIRQYLRTRNFDIENPDTKADKSLPDGNFTIKPSHLKQDLQVFIKKELSMLEMDCMNSLTSYYFYRKTPENISKTTPENGFDKDFQKSFECFEKIKTAVRNTLKK
jgi:hypothetical protein